ncbi:MAG TPA: hypothetical protein VFJ69_03335, partial [Actinomycetota bacterium]|nr:hypothetical protein [Actinomycetota bacterium]
GTPEPVDPEDDMGPPTVLLVGYNGANNTGAEALLQADLADLRAVLGPHARLTVPTLNAANLRRYLHETPTLRIAPIPSVFPGAVRRLVREHDLVVLVEGAPTWTPGPPRCCGTSCGPPTAPPS